MLSSGRRVLVPLLVAFVMLLAPVAAWAVRSADAGSDDFSHPDFSRSAKAEMTEVPNGHARYIVVLKDSVGRPGAVAEAQIERREGELGFVYRHALKGYSAILPRDEVEALRSDPKVAFVERDVRGGIAAQTSPTGIKRIFAPSNGSIDIDERDQRTDVDVAVLDTGIDFLHTDLNVVAQVSCIIEFPPKCAVGGEDRSGFGLYEDGHGHGTHVGGTIGALDNGKGVVGVAPGARLWSVKVVDDAGAGFISEYLAGVEWVTGTRNDSDPNNDIEVANSSLGYSTFSGPSKAVAKALKGAAEAGVVHVAAAGNSAQNVTALPGSDPSVITVSALADSDGLTGSKGPSSCQDDLPFVTRPLTDDTLASFSNFGPLVEVAAPGLCILSTYPGDQYAKASGTSMASPHVAGAAALLASKSAPENLEDVEAIRDTILEEGNYNWTDSSGDGIQEPLLDVSDKAAFDAIQKSAITLAPTLVSGTQATLRGEVSSDGVETKYHFEYGTTTSYGTSVPVPSKAIATSSEFVSVSETIGGLKAGQTYHYRVVATGVGGTRYGADHEFQMSAPVVNTGVATDVGPFSGKVHGTVTPMGTRTTYYFEYGPTTSYGSKEPLIETELRSQSSPTDVVAELTGLSWESGYHYRLVAENDLGTTYGEDETFTTPWIEISDPETELPCVVWGCELDFHSGEFIVAELDTTPSINTCEHSTTLEIGEAVEAREHVVSGCALFACPAEGGKWPGYVSRFLDDTLEIRLRACFKDSFSWSKTGDLELQFDYGADGLGPGYPWAPFQKYEKQGQYAVPFANPLHFLGEWETYDYLDINVPKPESATEKATNVTPTEATLNGTVTANGPETQYWFEYAAAEGGLGTYQALTVPLLGGEVAGSEGKFEVSETIEGLGQGALYHYRLVAKSPLGRTYGKAMSFRTPPHSDVDGDGYSDVVTIDHDGTAKVYRGNGFSIEASSAKSSLAGQLGPALLDGVGQYALDVADVTGEGRSDLITIGSAGGISVYPGQTDRSFGSAITTVSAKVLFNGSGGHEPIALAYVTGDRHADYVGFTASNGLVTVPGKSDGTLDTAKAVASLNGTLDTALTDASGHYFLDAIDVNGDGVADVVSIKTDGKAYVFKGKSNGEFEAAKEAATIDPIMDNGSGQEPAGLADVSGDGLADLVTLDGSKLKVWAGKADATFAAATEPYSGSIDSNLMDGTGEELIGLADFYSDSYGKADLISIKEGDIRRYLTQPDDTITGPATYEGAIEPVRGLRTNGQEVANEKPIIRRQGCTATGCRWWSRPAETDTIGDGRSNLVSVHSSKTAFVWGGNVIGAASPTESLKEALDPALLDGSGQYVFDVADVTGEGRSDLVTFGGVSGVSVYPGQTNRSFGTAITTASGKPIFNGAGPNEPIAAADYNGDGRADYVGFAQTTGGFVSVLAKSDGTFDTANAVYSLNGTVDSALTDASGHYFLDAIDVTGDKVADVVSIKTDGKAYVFKGKSNGEFEAAKEAATINPIFDNGTGQEPIGLGDVTGDGRADLLTLDGTVLKLWAGQEAGTFAAATEPYGSAIDSNLMDKAGLELIGLLDQNRDGRADLFAVDAQGAILGYLAQSNSTFAAPTVASLAISSIRHNTSGHEFASEKPMLRRAGCEAGGCMWP